MTQAAPAPVVVRDPRKVFIIYGRNTKAYEAMRLFVRSLGLQASDFRRMVELAGGSPYVGQLIHDNMKKSQAVIALFTPDEFAELRAEYPEQRDRKRWQARQNVIFEAGMAMGIDDSRTILVSLGEISLSSDMDGRHVARMDNTVDARDHLKGRLATAGCVIQADSDWHTAGDFDSASAAYDVDAVSSLSCHSRSLCDYFYI